MMLTNKDGYKNVAFPWFIVHLKGKGDSNYKVLSESINVSQIHISSTGKVREERFVFW